MLSLAPDIVVFAGPSLPRALRPMHPRLAWRPPALAGDLLALTERPPAVAVLIDGLFDASPAVRHKEILALMATGTAVIGAASMGALRAAELHAFGMIGVGRIEAAYRSGRITGDDEVALLHGPAELDWPALSEPLIEVRATLLAARRRQLLGREAARALLRAAQGMFYQDRTWPAVLAAAGGAKTEAFGAWLPGGRAPLKRRDALDAVQAALALTAGRPGAGPPRTLFTAELAVRRAARDELRLKRFSI